MTRNNPGIVALAIQCSKSFSYKLQKTGLVVVSVKVIGWRPSITADLKLSRGLLFVLGSKACVSRFTYRVFSYVTAFAIQRGNPRYGSIEWVL